MIEPSTTMCKTSKSFGDKHTSRSGMTEDCLNLKRSGCLASNHRAPLGAVELPLLKYPSKVAAFCSPLAPKVFISSITPKAPNREVSKLSGASSAPFGVRLLPQDLR